MKKRFFPLLALLLLLPAGRAETPYEGYTLDFGYPLPFQLKLLNDHEFLTTGWDDPDGHTSRPGHVTWWRDYRVFRDRPTPSTERPKAWAPPSSWWTKTAPSRC